MNTDEHDEQDDDGPSPMIGWILMAALTTLALLAGMVIAAGADRMMGR